jgi:hypothetical protein
MNKKAQNCVQLEGSSMKSVWIKRVAQTLCLSTVGLVSSAWAAGVAGATSLTLPSLVNNVDSTEYHLSRILLLVLILTGVLLILKGLVHLKQQYTSGGGGQEKHLSKGIASLVFGACMFMVIPIAHMFSSAVGGNANPNWSISGSSAVSITKTGNQA